MLSSLANVLEVSLLGGIWSLRVLVGKTGLNPLVLQDIKEKEVIQNCLLFRIESSINHEDVSQDVASMMVPFLRYVATSQSSELFYPLSLCDVKDLDVVEPLSDLDAGNEVASASKDYQSVLIASHDLREAGTRAGFVQNACVGGARQVERGGL